jgi:NTP pyrophosphatase (non-canonical NTP hydrolase)
MAQKSSLSAADETTTIKQLKRHVRRFVQDRKWGKYHNPKDLAAAISIEASELLDLFKWRNNPNMRKALKDLAFREAVSEELADVLIYCLTFADALGIDVSDSVIRKIDKNSAKYPVSRYKGDMRI